VLKGLTDRAEKVRSGILTAAEDETIDWLETKLERSFTDYEAYLEALESSPRYRENTMRQLRRLASDCEFSRIGDLNASKVETWLASRTKEKLAARTRNSYRMDAITFANWCVDKGRLITNPFSKLPIANERADRRRQRRAMTEAELVKLLEVARWRPLAEYGRQTVARTDSHGNGKSKRANWTYVPLNSENLTAAVERARERLKDNPRFIAELEQRGRERALIYKTLVLTGLRKGELAAVRVGQLDLDASPAFIALNAAEEKNREGSTIVLRADLADDLRKWLADREATRQEAARNAPTIKFDAQGRQVEKTRYA
jgi:integrase